MEAPYIHFAGFVGESRERSVTISVRRGTSKADTLFLLTKMIEMISRTAIEDLNRPFNEVRLMTAGDDAGMPRGRG
jgi:hypothetical protein